MTSDQDRRNAQARQQAARPLNDEYARCLQAARKAFGRGWLPRCKQSLVDKEEEDKARKENRRPAATLVVYTVRHRTSGAEQHFTVDDQGGLTVWPRPREMLEDLMRETHPTAGFWHREKWCRIPRFSLHWSEIVQYRPRSAEQLARLRDTRERKKKAREQQAFARDFPLFAQAGLGPEEVKKPKKRKRQ